MRIHSAESSNGWVSQETGGLPLALGEPGVWMVVASVARAPSPANCRHELRTNPRKKEKNELVCATKAYLRVPARGRGRPRHIHKKRKRPRCFRNVAFINAGNDLRSHTLSRAVPSALRGLTSVFGMGTGGSPAVRSPTSRSRQHSAVSFQQKSCCADLVADARRTWEHFRRRQRKSRFLTE